MRQKPRPYPITSPDVNREIVRYLSPREVFIMARLNRQFRAIVQGIVTRQDSRHYDMFKRVLKLLSSEIAACRELSVKWENYQPPWMMWEKNRTALKGAADSNRSALRCLLSSDRAKFSIVSPFLDQQSPIEIETSLEKTIEGLWYAVYFASCENKRDKSFITLNKDFASLMLRIARRCVFLLRGTADSGTTYDWTQRYANIFSLQLSVLQTQIKETEMLPIEHPAFRHGSSPRSLFLHAKEAAAAEPPTSSSTPPSHSNS